jgi:hypothetical protein
MTHVVCAQPRRIAPDEAPVEDAPLESDDSALPTEPDGVVGQPSRHHNSDRVLMDGLGNARVKRGES